MDNVQRMSFRSFRAVREDMARQQQEENPYRAQAARESVFERSPEEYYRSYMAPRQDQPRVQATHYQVDTDMFPGRGAPAQRYSTQAGLGSPFQYDGSLARRSDSSGGQQVRNAYAGCRCGFCAGHVNENGSSEGIAPRQTQNRAMQSSNWRERSIPESTQPRASNQASPHTPTGTNPHHAAFTPGQSVGSSLERVTPRGLVPYSGIPSPALTNPYSPTVQPFHPFGQLLSYQSDLVEQLANLETDNAGELVPYQPASPRLPSINYAGDLTNARNHSAAIEPLESSSLFLTHLPPNITVETLLNAICLYVHELDDRVFACSIRAPEPDKGYRHAAATIITFTRAGAERLYHRINNWPYLFIDGIDTRCTWNRTLSEPPEMRVPAHHSRVLLIRVRAAELARLVHTLSPLLGRQEGGVRFDTQDVGFWYESGGRNLVLEWIFGSYRGQAANVKGVIEKEMPGVAVWYGVDPCCRGTQVGSFWRAEGWVRVGDVLAGEDNN